MDIFIFAVLGGLLVPLGSFLARETFALENMTTVLHQLAVPHNITLVPLPPYAPELNPIENVWEYLRGNKLAMTVFDSYDDILDKACDAWTFFANDQNRIASITTRSWATFIL